MFINRAAELDTLKQEYERKGSSLTIIYGRRRVGKTALIMNFLADKKQALYFLATEESEPMNLEAFRSQAASFIGSSLLAQSSVGWQTVFEELVRQKREEKLVIVIDEFQYIGRSNEAFPSMVQKIWDLVLKDANIMLILCGSLITSMRRQTLEYDSPLYGRRTAQIRLKQIPFAHYQSFFPGKTEKELVRLYAVTGGVPKYIESFHDAGNIYHSIRQQILNPQSYLYEEPFFLLHNEVSEVGNYFSIIRAISMNNHKLSEISSFLGIRQTSLSRYLRVLMDLDILEREVPVTELVPEKSKNGLYYIRDNFLSFWFRFVYPYRGFLEKGETDYVMGKIREGFIPNHASYVYEEICREKLWGMAAAGQLPFAPMRIGRYWGSACGETDIVGFTPGEKHLLLGECKFSTTEKGLKVLHELQAKAGPLKKCTGTSEVYYVIFSAAGYTKGLMDAAQEDPTLLLL